MIEKMKHINLAGPVKDLDRTIETYISEYEIQLEYAARELYSSEGIVAFTEPNPYFTLYNEAKNFSKTVSGYNDGIERIGKDEAEDTIRRAHDFLQSQKSELKQLEEKQEILTEVTENLSHFTGFELNFEDLKNFKSINYRFGKMPVSGFLQFEAYLYDESKVLFGKGDDDGEFIWGMYFTPKSSIKKVDVMFSSLHFEVVDFPDEIDGEALKGKPAEILESLRNKLDELNRKATDIESSTLDRVGISTERMAAAYKYVEEMFYCYDCRKYAVKTSYDYFVFVGWMTERDALKLSQAVERDEGVVLLLENDNDSIMSKPPTKLKNNLFFKPFEFLVRMYGIPSYSEVDPTPFVALSYSICFGMMYGDVGQGAVLSVVGFLLHKYKKMALGSILAIVGLFSMVFGFLYGSVFGFEHVLKSYWLKPAEDIMELVIYTISFGFVIILICMVYNIVNSVKKKDMGKLIFDTNGIAGLLFYTLVIAFALAIAVFGVQIPTALIVICVGIPLLLIAFKEPITDSIIKKKKHKDKKERLGMFLFVTLMEVIEILLSFFTNTLSFVRVGGFAVCHAGLMSVVMLLAGGEGGNSNIVVVIIGNIFVMALEGLIVFIQVMRLEFYEMFSRYYEGNGKEFVAYRDISR